MEVAQLSSLVPVRSQCNSICVIDGMETRVTHVNLKIMIIFQVESAFILFLTYLCLFTARVNMSHVICSIDKIRKPPSKRRVNQVALL